MDCCLDEVRRDVGQELRLLSDLQVLQVLSDLQLWVTLDSQLVLQLVLLGPRLKFQFHRMQRLLVQPLSSLALS
jgi:hypothetical protein